MYISIKIRFLLSYVGIIFVSIILLLVAGFLIVFVITGDVKAIEHFYKKTYVQKPLTESEENAFLDLKLLAKNDPAQLLNRDQVQKIEHHGIKIVVRKEQDVVYASPSLNKQGLIKSLPSFEAANINTRDTIRMHDLFFTYVKFDFYFSDKELGSIFVLRKASSYAELTRSLFPILFGVLLLLFIIIIGLLNYMVSRSIIKPISVLKEGTEKIKAGDLDFRIRPGSDDEIGQLNTAFEEMRSKLKASVELQMQLEENRKALLSNISHDLRTPITSIIGYVEGIQDGVANTPQKMDKYLTTIHQKAREMDAMIEEVFLFSKLDLKKEPFTFKTIELRSYLQDYIDGLQLELTPLGIQIDLQLVQKPLYVLADQEKLTRVIANLINNSVKYMHKTKKQLSIRLSEEAGRAIIQVSDNGSGIEHAALPHIFDRFYRAEKSRNSETGGSGLGLAIAKQIIEQHGGDIWAASEQGKGTSVFFSLKKGEER